ncbi:HSP20-like chaperone [Lasiosphaeria miniovina]|uniref:HSP20-like chaperone n=1 Tax=Lasiosphaeria miniovina TaxID=1954250 RepID=A0AA39ZUF2_9PEZI|nr:HSP20-like chaperone [Lasiosphaeria miniovina]KAK0703797.1 HSP20-like chaperone [Lasiosphaeria miniovina]
MSSLASHPFARQIRSYIENAQAHQQQGHRGAEAGNTNDDDYADSESFVPPVDIFNTPNNWTVHLSVPGAKKDDVAVNWDADKSLLAITGVVHRPGNEDFLAGMLSGERRVGMFERKIRLPPLTSAAAATAAATAAAEKEEVDADHITARMEDGILIVVVPKAEKEWTEVRKVDIE